MFFLHALRLPMNFHWSVLLIFELLCAVLISAIHSIFLCFLSMQAIHSTVFFLFHYFSQTFHSMWCAIDVLFNFAIIILSTSVVLVFFPIFLFGKLFVGCQRCSGSPPLPVARNTGLPFTTRSWLHRFPIHHQLMATQGPFIAVASYTGFPFVIKG